MCYNVGHLPYIQINCESPVAAVMIGKGLLRLAPTQIGDMVSIGNTIQTNQTRALFSCTDPVSGGKPGRHQTKPTKQLRRHCEKYGKGW